MRFRGTMSVRNAVRVGIGFELIVRGRDLLERPRDMLQGVWLVLTRIPATVGVDRIR